MLIYFVKSAVMQPISNRLPHKMEAIVADMWKQFKLDSPFMALHRIHSERAPRLEAD